ncbi:MAG: hypothetical protein CSA26_01315 [Desulfobacterales bacterium]|nr:MAG: hypothetical protein CSA26_01315 [Desulfobacterales bacterium]
MDSKKILLVTTFFYPQNRIPVLRIGQWAKYWALEGHEVTVLTTEKYPFEGPLGLDVLLSKSIKVIEIDYLPKFLKKILIKKPGTQKISKEACAKGSNIKKIVRDMRKYLGSLLDIHDLWIKQATKKALKLCRINNYDCVISSYSPPAVHIVAQKIKKLHPNIIWIADFRDLWAYNHLQHAKGLLGVYEKYKERRILRCADVLITVSDPLTEKMKKYYPNKKIVTIENGFDEEQFPLWKKNIKKKKLLGDKLVITYTGTIYDGKMDPRPLFRACNELIDENFIKKENLSICFYGNNTNELSSLINKYNYNKYSIIELKGFVSRKQSLLVQKNSDLLLFLEWNDPYAKGILTGKLFEYLVSGVPILAVGVNHSHSASKLIEDTRTGKLFLNVSEIKNFLVEIFLSKEFTFEPDIKMIDTFSRCNQARKVMDLVNRGC